MIKVGLTGGIGAGKSMIANFFKYNGIPVYNSDIRAKEILFNSDEVKDLVCDRIGNEVVSKNGIEKNKLTEIVFSNPDKLKILNSIIHPIVLEDFNKWCEERNNSKIVIIEAAILFESGFNNHVDKIITITSPEEIRINRVVKRDKVSREQVVARLENQMTDLEREKFSDFILNNDDKELIIPNILVILDRIKNNN